MPKKIMTPAQRNLDADERKSFRIWQTTPWVHHITCKDGCGDLDVVGEDGDNLIFCPSCGWIPPLDLVPAVVLSMGHRPLYHPDGAHGGKWTPEDVPWVPGGIPSHT